MRTINNAFHTKVKLRPKDYAPDQTVGIRNKNTGKMVTVPAVLLRAVRSGQLKLIK